ncbi:MAG: hypothetical protein K0R26_1761 [Bacteroidota bacterium]|jgi:nucleotide-binding universal stress UspA family protein|nr:hypothetical protein [Bacteroidota bacterium]
MKKILVTTDFSEAAHNAALYAAELANVSGARILLHHATADPTIVMETESEVNDPADCKKLLAEETILLNKKSGVLVDGLLTEGDASSEIIKLENTKAPDLLVAGMKASSKFRKFMFGSVATDVINKMHTPIIVVPENYKFKTIAKIAFGIDFEMKKELQMHPTIQDLYTLFKPASLLINIVKQGAPIRPNDPVSERNIEKYFENRGHTYHFLEDNDIMRGLKEFVSWHKIDLLVMLPRERNLLEKLFSESKTKKMAFNTEIPLMILPAI